MTQEKLHISQAVIVEGKYDKIKLESVIDALIITTNGFGIFKDKEKTALLRTLAKKCGLLIITDSDHAGFMIRSHLKGVINQGEIINVYIPDIFGKEKRKQKPSKEGKLGVEGIDTTTLVAALEKAGVFCEKAKDDAKPVKEIDLYQWGLFGKDNSKQKRVALQKILELPENLNKNSLLEILNRLYSFEEIENVVNKL